MTTFSWSATCTSSLKSLGGVPDYADSSLPLLGPLANMNSSFELDFVAGRCIDKHKKLVPYKTSGVRVDDIKAECTRRGLRVANTRSECVEILERSDGRDWNMCVEDFVLTDLDKKMPALIDTAEDKFSTWTWEKTVAILRQLRDAEGLVLLDLKLPAGKARETAKWLARSMLAMAAASDWVDPEEYKEPDLDPEDEEEDESEDEDAEDTEDQGTPAKEKKKKRKKTVTKRTKKGASSGSRKRAKCSEMEGSELEAEVARRESALLLALMRRSDKKEQAALLPNGEQGRVHAVAVALLREEISQGKTFEVGGFIDEFMMLRQRQDAAPGEGSRGVSLQEKLDELITKKVEEASAGHKAELERIGKSSNFQLAALTATSTASG